MKPPQRVVWAEGMLMSPNHMQQLDAYHEELLASRLRALTPHDWGVVSLQIDKRALDGGQFRFSELVAVLPDGLFLAFDHDDPETPPARPIEGHWKPTQPVLEVFVGVPREREGAANYGEGAGRGGRVRYKPARRPIWDTTTGAGELPVAFAQRNVVVLFGDEPRDDYEVLKVAEVVRDKNGAPQLSDPYVPPSLRLGAAPFLVEGVKRTLALAVTKQRSLSEQRRQREDATVEFVASDVTRYLLLNALNTNIPVLAHLGQQPDLPPRTAYLALCQFAGALMSFASDADPTSLPAFAYTDLRSTFEPLFARILALLNATVRDNYVSAGLEARQDGLHLGRLDDERFLRATSFVLAVRSTKLSEAQIADALPKLAKIASWSDIPQLVQATSPGVPVALTHRPPPEIPVKAGLVYFTLGTGDRFWRNVAAERNLAVYLPPPFAPQETQIQIMAVPQGAPVAGPRP